MRLQNQVAIITGSGSGIGQATALRFAREGAQIVVADRNAAGAQETAAQIDTMGGIELVVLQEQTDAHGRHQWQEVARTTTDGQGRYAFAGLVSGNYQVELGAAARRSEQDFVIFDETNLRSAQATAQGAINGTITEQRGKAAKQVAVSLYAIVTQGDYSYEQLVRRTLTDEKGRYKFKDLSMGQYKVGFADVLFPERYVAEYYTDAPDLWTATVVDLAGNGLQIDAQLAPAGSITGRVSNVQGEALGGIGVELNRYIDDGYGYVDWQSVNWSSTSNDGTYTFSGLATGIYRLRYVDNQWPARYAPEFYNNAATLAVATDVVVLDGANVSGIDVQLAAASQVVGTITDPTGQPLEGIGVNLYTAVDGDGYWQQTYSSGTDNTGTYVVDGLPAGVYRVEFTDWMMWPPRYQGEFYNDAATVETAADVTVGEGVVVSGIDAQLATTGHIQGQVLNAAGQPLVDAVVSVYIGDEGGYWYPFNSVATDAMGFYDLGGLMAGNYRVGFAYRWEQQPAEYYNDAATVEEATSIALAAGATVTDINAQLPEPGAIQGMVTDSAGQPLPNIVVSALRQISLPDGTAGWSFAGTTMTAANGAYLLDNLAAGSYAVEFADYNNWPHQYSGEYYDNVTDLANVTLLPVAAGATTSDINAQLALTGAITGQVLDAAGAPLAEIAVAALRLMSDGFGNSYWGEVNGSVTNADGTYTLAGLDVGTYRLLFRDNQWPRRYATLYYHNVADLQNAEEIAVAAGAQVNGIDAQMTTGSQLSGMVTDQAGGALAEINVTLFRSTSDGAGNLYWEYYGDTLTQADGSYTLAALSAGTYRLGFFDWHGQYQSVYYANAAELASATDIPVDGQQAVAAINVQLPPLTAMNVAPLARNDRFVLTGDAGQHSRQDGGLNILRNDTDPNGDTLSAKLISAPQHGALTLHVDGSFTYVPDRNHVGIDRFTYQATDGSEQSNMATVELVIEPAPAAQLYKVWIPLVVNE